MAVSGSVSLTGNWVRSWLGGEGKETKCGLDREMVY